MTSFNEAAQASQELFLTTVRQSQQAVVDAVNEWAKAVENVVPASPAIPGSEQVPRPEAVVENAFDFAQKLLDAQRDFARNLIAAAGPVLEKSAETNGQTKGKKSA
jgi:hypothetical protein